MPVAIDFLPAVQCKGWWPVGNRCDQFLDEKSMQLGCQMIIKPPNVPFYQHAKFGFPHHYVKMSFSEAETSLFLKCHENIRRAFIISKLLLDRQVKLPWKILQPDSDDPFGISAIIQTRNCITSYILKQSLFNVLMENQHDTETNEESILVWVQRIFSRYRKSLKDGSLQSVFLPQVNILHTFQPDDGLENSRNILVQVIHHSLLAEEVPLEVNYDTSWYRCPTSFECTMHNRFRYLNLLLQSPEERE